MQCSRCQSDTKIVDSRDSRESPGAVRRRRQCRSCGHRFTTYERDTQDVDRADRVAIGEAAQLLEQALELVRGRLR